MASALLNPRLSLTAVAESLNLSLPALTLLLARPDIAEQLAAIHSAAAQRTRIAAAQHLPLAVEVLASIAATHRDEDHAPGFDAANPRHRILRLRHRESARRAASTLLRLANYFPRSPRPHAHDEVGSPTESWRCPAPALAAPSRATEERVPASSSVLAHSAPLATNGSSPSSPPALAAPSRATEERGSASSSVLAHSSRPAANSPSSSAPLHREAVAVSSRSLPRSGTPGNESSRMSPSPTGLNAPTANQPRPGGAPGCSNGWSEGASPERNPLSHAPPRSCRVEDPPWRGGAEESSRLAPNFKPRPAPRGSPASRLITASGTTSAARPPPTPNRSG